MSNWVLTAGERWLLPVYHALHKELLANKILHADETTLMVLREPERQALADELGEDGIQELAQRTGLANATLTSMLDRMERKNLLRRTADPGDRRKIRILLTEQAFGLREKYDAVTAAMTGITCQGFSEEEIEQLESYMERVLRNVQNYEKQPTRTEVSK